MNSPLGVMAHINLIIPATGSNPEPGSIEAVVERLSSAGHQVDVIHVDASDTEAEIGGEIVPGRVRSAQPGLAAAAVAGLDAATGEILVVLDAGGGYSPGEVAAVVAPLLRGEADLVVGSRYTRQAGGLRMVAGYLGRVLVGTSDPLSGLVAVSRAALAEFRARFSAVGRSFTMELVTKVAGRHIEVPARSDASWRLPRLGWDDLRHAKRLADHRYGTLSRLFQFCTVGFSGMIVDLTIYALLLKWLGATSLASFVVPPTKIPASRAAAGFTAVFVALCWNFSLNRRLTFADARRHSPLVRQFLTYALGNCLSIVVSLGLRLGLPRWVPAFKYHELTAAVIGIVAGTAISFSMARWIVFRKARAQPAPHPPAPTPAAESTPKPDEGLVAAGS